MERDGGVCLASNADASLPGRLLALQAARCRRGTKAWWDEEAKRGDVPRVRERRGAGARAWAGRPAGRAARSTTACGSVASARSSGVLGDRLGRRLPLLQGRAAVERAPGRQGLGRGGAARAVLRARSLAESAIVASRPAHSWLAREHRPHRRRAERRLGDRRQGRTAARVECRSVGPFWRPELKRVFVGGPRPHEARARDGRARSRRPAAALVARPACRRCRCQRPRLSASSHPSGASSPSRSS